jgi:SAM-dependent methyltransferase
MALNGAKLVVGIDINKEKIEFCRKKISNDYQSLLGIVDFRYVDNIGKKKFDIVLSKDSFEHYSNPEDFILTMKQYLKKDGIMVIGFSPLWKSPYGGHISDMTKFPWAHLIFPKSIIIAEQNRFYPKHDVMSCRQFTGGLNKMTLRRYLKIIQKSGLEISFFRTNISSRKTMALLNILRQIPFCREFFTVSVYSILKRIEAKTPANVKPLM